MAEIAHAAANMGVDHWASIFIVIQLGGTGAVIAYHGIVGFGKKTNETIHKVREKHRHHHDDVH